MNRGTLLPGCETRSRRLRSMRPAAFLLVLLLCSVSFGRPPMLKVDPMSLRPRTGGPVLLRLKLDYSDQQLLEGDLLLKIYNNRQNAANLMATLRYEGIVLQGTDYEFNAMLPPLPPSFKRQYEIEAWFETADQRIPLSTDPDQLDPPATHQAFTSDVMERSVMVASVSGRRSSLQASANRAFLASALNLNNYNPDGTIIREEQSAASDDRSIAGGRITYFASPLGTDDLSTDPLSLCFCDILLLADGALSRLETGQLEAVLQWVRAGGAVCIAPDEDRLKSEHLAFVRELIAGSPRLREQLSLDDAGRLQVLNGSESGVILGTCGLGRFAVLPRTDRLETQLTDDQVGRLAGHLWSARYDSPIHRGRSWHPTDIMLGLARNGIQVTPLNNGTYRIRSDDWNQRTTIQQRFNAHPAVVKSLEEVRTLFPVSEQMETRGNPAADAAEVALLPDDVEMVPVWLIGLILTGYVLVVGPGEYIVLGWFRARKFTWIVFPVITLLFTWMTVRIAHSYMASTGTGGSLSFVDVTRGGRTARVRRVQMNFYGGRTETTTQHSRELVVPLARGAFYDRIQGGQPAIGNDDRVVHFSGRMPSSYTVSQMYEQWKPALNVSLAIAPQESDSPEIPWDDFSLISTHEGRAALNDLIEAELQPDDRWEAFVLHQREVTPVHFGDLEIGATLQQSSEELRATQNNAYGYNYVITGMTRNQQKTRLLASAVLLTTAAPDDSGYFRLVSSTAPQGAGTLEELPILDTRNPHQWCLVIVVQRGADTTIYRRLFDDRDYADKEAQGDSPAASDNETEETS